MRLNPFLTGELDGWSRLLPDGWVRFLGDVQLNFDGIPQDLALAGPTYLTPPVRRYEAGSGEAAIFRAFSDVPPESVRVVVIGQDPYPAPGRATGRSFEDGLFAGWDGNIAPSLRRLRRAAVASRLRNTELLCEESLPWSEFKAGRERDDPLNAETMKDWFDRVASQGVLFANAALTLTVHLGRDRVRARDGHLAMWRPFMRRLHERLAAREGGPPVYLLLGHFARDELAAHIDGSRMLATLRRDGRIVERPHPRRAAFMKSNALDAVNGVLADPPITW